MNPSSALPHNSGHVNNIGRGERALLPSGFVGYIRRLDHHTSPSPQHQFLLIKPSGIHKAYTPDGKHAYKCLHSEAFEKDPAHTTKNHLKQPTPALLTHHNDRHSRCYINTGIRYSHHHPLTSQSQQLACTTNRLHILLVLPTRNILTWKPAAIMGCRNGSTQRTSSSYTQAECHTWPLRRHISDLTEDVGAKQSVIMHAWAICFP
jgi:hypothetical protein